MAFFCNKITGMKYLSFDIRALALMRICIATVILLDLSVRISDLEAFYSNTGVVPLPMLFEHGWNDYFLSIHTISGLWQVQFVLFMAAYFFAIMLFIGYRTRLFTCLSWFMLLSLHNRNSFILQGGDDLLRMVMFWCMFIPWGAKYSCDALLSETRFEHKTIFTVATVAYLLQLCYIYTGSALLKGPEWDTHYTAMYYVYGLEQIAYPFTKTLFYYPELLKKLTFIAYYFELLVPVLFFIPVKHQFFRFTGVLLIILFHGLNCLTLFIGMFPLIGMATSIGMLPTRTMDKFDRVTFRLKERISESFSGVSHYVQYIIRWKKPVYEFGPVLEKIKMAALIFLVVFVFDWNFSNLSFINSKLSDQLRVIGYSLRLDQNWGMFAPGVFKDDGWFVLRGTTERNENFNLLDPQAKLDFKKPASIVSIFKNDRWRKYTENLIFTFHTFLRGYFCNYYKRIWNEDNVSNKIRSLEIIYMSEFTLPDYKFSKPEKQVLWECH
jgi:hypothetical protein